MSGTPTVERALAVVGLTVSELREQVGSALTAGRPYLVGSLAAGLGNRGSDVDVHIFRGEGGDAPPFLMFVRDVPIDLEHFGEQRLLDLRAGVAAAELLATPFGLVGCPGPDLVAAENRLVRWLTALPLDAHQGPLFPDGERPAAFAVLLGLAWQRLVTMTALAEVAEAAGDLRAAGWLCARAGRMAVETVCRTQGSVVTGEKWLPSRASRCGVSADAARRAMTAADTRGLVAALAELGLPPVAGILLTAVCPDPEARKVSIGRQHFLLTRHRRVYRSWRTANGPTAAVLAEVGAAELLAGLRTGQLLIDVTSTAMKEVLSW